MMINVSWDNQKSPTHCCRPTRKRLIHVLTREGNHGLAGHHKTGLLQIKFLINAVNKELLVVVVLVLLLPGRNCHKMTTWKFNAQLKLTAANCSRPTAFLLSAEAPTLAPTGTASRSEAAKRNFAICYKLENVCYHFQRFSATRQCVLNAQPRLKSRAAL